MRLLPYRFAVLFCGFFTLYILKLKFKIKFKFVYSHVA